MPVLAMPGCWGWDWSPWHRCREQLMSNPDLRALSRFSDSLSYAYLEHAVIEQEQHSIAAFTPDGRISLPAANLSCLLLGPGTRITHGHHEKLSNLALRNAVSQ